MVTPEEVKPLQGVVIVRAGGPVDWCCMREKRTSRSSTKAEIKSIDKGKRQHQYLHDILQFLDKLDRTSTTPIYNNNKWA